MQLSEAEFGEARPIDSYGPGFFRISGQVHRGPTWISSNRAGPWGGTDDIATLISLRDSIDVLLVGMGAEIAPLPATLRTPLEAAGIGVEVMATPAACRTFNVLLSEGRRVAAAMLPV